ncbi:glycogen/starch/alpha-glucan phosphorylase [Cyanobium sp. Cruz CV13-4-11]|jgi:starch phosphorylase|uniref:glycogen/starch/alpha-glucan phosphorylase n=1 Tax=unclassified Cyanobium TaxID=2627006 RepID=UPI0020CCCCDF|nr:MULTISPECIES: glycogen/starch/alpha-glucan phosphorylase [unclassified Cyanobium]MCP9901688.1 glycogen/starch/alpha-glucan phosphorylase [Cyanobium sp. Cruz CV11-17]MCP9920726.1 glycogen/starch/alpha-glucan phosphorylase [Cyanobium sp. Cruz CV13-4-11]
MTSTLAPVMGLPEPGTYADPQRNGLAAKDLLDGLIEHLFYSLGRRVQEADRHDLYMALSYAVRDRLMTRYLAGLDAILASPTRVVAYLSAEFLIGPQLGNNLLMLGIQEEAAEALRLFGINDIEEILDVEEEPGLGNGGLGRLAACFLESLASLEIPATGYGIRYEFGIFDQLIRDGWQVEITDKWLKGGWPWEIVQPEKACVVGFGGHTESYRDDHGTYRVRWVPGEQAIGIPHDVPVLGYRVNTCDRLRLWRAEACESFDFQTFNSGDFYGAVERKVGSETLSKVLYPNDGTDAGRRLRLMQQHFFVSCSLQDMVRSLEARGLPIQEFPQHWAVQLNDTHPSIAVAELMRLLLDDKHLEWDAAWAITTACLSYTNHTLLPEALETWGLDLFGSLLPRHLELIFEINHRFLQQVRLRHPGNDAVLRRLSIIDEAGDKAVRMAHLATVGSHHVNGVAALHSALVKQDLFPEFAALWPEKFTNVTNGVTPRRWLALANPALHALLCDSIGADWLAQPQSLRRLEEFQRDGAFLERWAQCKRTAKQRLAGYIHRQQALSVDPESLFDVQVKRIHEYKRQHLNALQVIAQYLRIKNGRADGLAPRTVIFGGKAAPGYAMAKLIIRFINGIADVVNADPDMDGRLRVIFLADYNVKLGERVYPAADLSEQISTAGLEASGTGNMKFMMNGALTIGTLDGANVEIREQVGADNFFLFGRTTEEIGQLRGHYRPWEWLGGDPLLAEVFELIDRGHFSQGDSDRFRPLTDQLRGGDPFFVLADFSDYLRAQDAINATWADRNRWNLMALLNTARSGFFSSDRAIGEYAERIWDVTPSPVAMTGSPLTT